MNQTIINLGRGFAGESQAHMRYMLYAKQAKKEGKECLGNMFANIARNEMAHAKIFLNLIKKYKPGAVNQNIEAGFPMLIGTLEENLRNSENGEHDEYQNVYPSFAEVAKGEGVEDAARMFSMIAEIEKIHCNEFGRISKLISEGRLYSSKEPIIWRCYHCGHEITDTQPWVVCPVCAHPQGFVEIPKGHR